MCDCLYVCSTRLSTENTHAVRPRVSSYKIVVPLAVRLHTPTRVGASERVLVEVAVPAVIGAERVARAGIAHRVGHRAVRRLVRHARAALRPHALLVPVP